MTASPHPERRPGPVAFRAESKVTSQKSTVSSNQGGMGEVTLSVETPRRSTEVKVVGLWFWLLAGLFMILVGLLAFMPLMWAGVALVVGVGVTRRNNTTEQRLRNQFETERD